MNIKILRGIDKYIFGFLVLLVFWLKYFSINKKNTIRHHPKKVLVIRLWALGSSLLTFPMIKQLRDHYGNTIQYDLLATSRNIRVFKNQGYFKKMYNLFTIKDLIKIILSFKKYDIVIDSEEYFKLSALITLRVGKITTGYANIWNRKIAYIYSVHYQEMTHNLMNCLRLLEPLDIKIHIPEAMEKLVYHKKDKIKVDNFLKQRENRKIICLHTGGAETSTDRFRSQENWIKLIRKIIIKYGYKVIVVLSGTKFEEKGVKKILHIIGNKKNVISICGKFNLFEFAYFFTKCDIMISNDTGPMHLSASMGTRTIGIFGPNLPQIFGPWPLDKNISLYNGYGTISIKPHLGVFKKDVANTVNNITTSDVMEAVSKVICI